MTDGQPLRRPDGRQPLFNADSLALSKDGSTLYWQALTSKTLYRIATSAIQSAAAAGPARPPKKGTTGAGGGGLAGGHQENYFRPVAHKPGKGGKPPRRTG